MDERKSKLIRFLVNGIDEAKFNNGLQGRQLGFKSYNDFVRYQTQLVNQFNEDSVTTLEMIRDNLLPVTKIIDRTSMNTYKSAGFIFDISDNIVFYGAQN
jgi:hypothetical protein